jgi:hypothetical protein
MHPTHTLRPRPDRPYPTRRILGATCAAAVAAMLAGCAPRPVEESLRIEFKPGPGSDVRMEIRAEVELNRDAADADDEAVRQRIEQVAAELADGTGPWHERFDRLGNPASDGIDLGEEKGELSRFQRWAVMTDPGSALADFFADTRIVPAYEVSGGHASAAGQPPLPRTVTLTFRPAGEFAPTDVELADPRRELLKVANAIVRLQDTVDEMWTYLEQNPRKRRRWIAFLALGDDEGLDELEADLSAYEEELWTRLLDDTFSALWPEEAIDGDQFGLYEELDEVLHAFPANVTVKPDGEVVEAVGFHEAEDAWALAAGDISRAVVDVLEETISPNFARFWATVDLQDFFRGSRATGTNDEAGCDRDCQLDEILAGPFLVHPAEASDIAEKLEKALTPLGEYRLRWIRP